jgi:hypothetical protein
MKLRQIFLGIILVISVPALRSQDYTLRFAGTGLITTVDSVHIVNVTRGNSLTIPGSQALHLNGMPGGSVIKPGEIRFYPNPMYNYSRMEFDSQEAGLAWVAIYDVSGREVTKIRQYLPAGQHTFRITGTMSGIYMVKIYTDSYSSYGKLVSANCGSEQITIEYEKSVVLTELSKAEISAGDQFAVYIQVRKPESDYGGYPGRKQNPYC